MQISCFVQRTWSIDPRTGVPVSRSEMRTDALVHERIDRVEESARARIESPAQPSRPRPSDRSDVLVSVAEGEP